MGVDEQDDSVEEVNTREGEAECTSGIDSNGGPDVAGCIEQLLDHRPKKCGIDFCPNEGVHKGYGAADRARYYCAEKHRPTWLDLKGTFYESGCFYCGRKFGAKSRRTRDHVVPTARGGSRMAHNVVNACFKCNQAKGILTGQEYVDLLPRGRHAVRLAENKMQNMVRESGVPAVVPLDDTYVLIRTVLAQHYIPGPNAEHLANDLLRVLFPTRH